MNALRRRLAARDDDESGFALIFVMLVTTLVMIGTATMLTVTVNNIVPSKQSQDALAAQAAARAGVQDFVANLNARCASYSIQACGWLGQSPTVTGALGGESWTVSPQNASSYLVNNGTVRVTSKGTGGGTRGVTRTVTADISGKPNVLRYTYFSNFETVGKAFLDSYFPARTVTVNDQAVADALGKPLGTTITWAGTSQAPSNAYTDDVCNALYYADPTNPAGVSSGRATTRAARTALPVGTDFAEDGSTQTPAQKLLGTSTAATRYAPCEVTLSKGMTFNGPVYSRDALYLSNGEWGSTTGPSFTVPTGEDLPAASTGWTAAPNPVTPFRTAAQLGGTPTTSSTSTAQLVQTSPFQLSLPTAANPQATCTYTGPTRIVLSGTTATVTSPQTTAAGGACYTSTGSGTGVVAAQVPVTSTTISVATGTGTTAPTFPGLALGANGDITTYSPSAGDLYVEGSLTSGKLSLVAAHDIVVTGDLKTGSAAATTNAYGEPSWNSANGAVDLIATNNVRVYHPVACKTGTATNGYCANDITGLYTTSQSGIVIQNDGTLRATHPSLQYCNLTPTKDCTTDVTAAGTTREIDAAVFALNGSLVTDNYSRGRALGGLLVKGGVYESHRGPTGQLWEIPTATSTRHNAGYKLQVSYLSYQAAGLPFVPVLRGGSITSPWQVISTSTGGS